MREGPIPNHKGIYAMLEFLDCKFVNM